MKRMTHSRRSLMAAAGLTLAVTLAACGGSETDNAGGDAKSGSGGQVVFANYGGSTGEAFKSAYWDPFTKKTGIEVVSADADPARYVAMMQSGSSEWDTMDADGFAVADYVNKDIVEKLPADVPRSDMVDEKYRDYTAGGYTQSYVLAYDSSALPEAPTSWADFWDTNKFPGKRGIANYYIGTAESALLADGEAADQLFPLDLGRAFNKWEELRSNLTISESYAAAIQALQAGSTTMALVPSGRAAVLSQQDPKFKIMWEQNIFYPWSGLTIPKGAPNADNMAELLKFMQDPKRQADFAKKSYYGPTLKAAYDLVPDDVAALLPGTPEHSATAAPIDTEKLAKQTDDYIKAFGDWVAK
jgi:putative spermidine/putrescine transport system substrate-binding protein